jgi:hypothetical protein
VRRLVRGLALLLALAAAPAAGQTVSTSARPERVAVTVYRAPGRTADQAFNRNWLNGYALITETRTVSIPAGESVIRFEGVAGGIIPQSAIVAGLPEGVIERNHDAWLLSPSSLLDRSLGRRVHLRRTSLATGAVREQEAVIRSGADGAVVVETAEGVEAVQCSGLSETLVYPGVPEGLSATPTLSVRARSSRAATATLTLSYLATGFDWQANYVISLSPGGERADIFAWLTLASNDETSFVAADTQAVAGVVNRESDRDPRRQTAPSPTITLRCWPDRTTSDIPLRRPEVSRGFATSRDYASVSPLTVVQDEEFQLSGTVNVENLLARQEDLGDLKLYRLPEPVTIASNSQKQVAMIQRSGVAVETVYRRVVDAEQSGNFGTGTRVLVTRNRSGEGLGIPLPAGRVILLTGGPERPLLLAEGFMRDLAVGEDVEIELGAAPSAVSTTTEIVGQGRGWQDYLITAFNDGARPARFELEIDVPAGGRLRPRQRLGQRDGRRLWSVTVPANGEAALRYRLHLVRTPPN